MRPNVDIGWETHGAIKKIAEVRFDGDLDRAYNHVLTKGLKYSAIPEESKIEDTPTGDVLFIPTQHQGSPITFHRYLQHRSSLYSIGHGPYTSFELSEVSDILFQISRYPDVHVENSAFGIRRKGGNWVGWGFRDFIESLMKPTKRYSQTDFTQLVREEVGLVFGVGSGYVIIRAQHLPDEQVLGDLHLSVVSRGLPVNTSDSIRAILGEFGTELGDATQLSEQNSSLSTQLPIEIQPQEYVTHKDTVTDTEWGHAVVVENPFNSSKVATPNPAVSQLKSVVVWLSDHEIMDEAPSDAYYLRDCSTIVNCVVNVSLSGTWERSNPHH